MNLIRYTSARKSVGLKHTEIADAMNISRQELYIRIKNDTLTIENVRVLSKLLHQPVTWFFGRNYPLSKRNKNETK